MKPIVAVVGRPNVGKSTLFNRIAGRRIAIVEDKPGVTRDRIYSEADWSGYDFILIDTGGIELYSEDKMLSQIRRQAQIAIETCDVIVFVVDGKEGITQTDEEIALMLRKTKKPIILTVNKVDNQSRLDDIFQFYNLGMGEPFAVSSTLGLGTGDLMDKIISYFKKINEDEENGLVTKVAIIGKPNVGKSSLVNRLLKEERVIVSDIAGTTRDAIDTPLEINGEKYILIDTAGIRRKSKVNEEVEKYSVIRALTAIERSDVCLVMVNGEEGITDQDTKIASYAHEAGKGIVIVVNKWDIVKKDERTAIEFKNKIKEDMKFMTYAPIIFISAKTGQKVEKLIEQVKFVAEQNSLRVTTGVLNDVLSDALMMSQPPTIKGKKLKIFYATQASTKPPTFVLFVNDTEVLHFSYERYLENQLRERFGLEGTPIRFVFKSRNEDNEN